MIQSQKQSLTHGQIVQLHHVQNKTYLYSDNIKIKHEFSFIKKKALVSEKYIVGGQPMQDVKNLWQVVRKVPQSENKVDYAHELTTINYDDCIQLRHYITNRYLTSDDQQGSQTSKQGEVSCVNEVLPGAQQIFMFQKINDPYDNVPYFILDNNVHGDAIIKLININDNRALHSHTSMYTQDDANHLMEVTMFQNRDDNDYWEVQIVDQELLKSQYKISQPQYQLKIHRLQTIIHHQDKVILKSCLLGASLHSHSRKYHKGSKEQEVTCRQTQPRDDNDWWQIKSIDDFPSLKHLSKINLLHVSTKNSLSSCANYKNPSGKGFEVCCQQLSVRDAEWQIIIVNPADYKNMPIEHPFAIKHISTNQYLGVFQNPSSPSDAQYEVGLIKDTCHATMWQVEQQDSIFS